MWSLPDINRLNEVAVLEHEANKDKTESDILKDQVCMYCEKSAEVYHEYYDIFSDTPKGYIFLCEEHDGYYGSPAEGYFYCDECNKTHVENYTWEVYSHCTEDGEIVCLNCFFDAEIENPDNWISSIEEYENFDITQCKHLIPVEGKHWQDHLEFIDNSEYDSMDGHCISGSASIEKVQEALKEHGEIILILDAAYQFAVSIGVYVKK